MRGQYTEQAKHALALASRTAHAYKHNYIGTEHILDGYGYSGGETGSFD